MRAERDLRFELEWWRWSVLILCLYQDRRDRQTNAYYHSLSSRQNQKCNVLTQYLEKIILVKSSIYYLSISRDGAEYCRTQQRPEVPGRCHLPIDKTLWKLHETFYFKTDFISSSLRQHLEDIKRYFQIWVKDNREAVMQLLNCMQLTLVLRGRDSWIIITGQTLMYLKTARSSVWKFGDYRERGHSDPSEN